MDNCKLDTRLPNELRKLLNDIEIYAGDDPLSPWLRCISFARTSLPADGFKSVYRNLLELCTKTFSEDDRYRSDMRYLQIWIQHADCCHLEAENVFSKMEALRIGQDSSLFYGAYAIYLEVHEKYLKANDMYQLGLLRQAKPLGLLEEAYKSFLKRMASRHRRQLIKEANPAVGFNTSIHGENIDLQPIVSSTFTFPSTQRVQSLHPLMDLSNSQKDPYQSLLVASSKCKDIKKFSMPLKPCNEVNKSCINGLPASKVNPWESSVIDKLLSNLKPPLLQYKGFHRSNQKYNGTSLSSLKSAPHNKVLELGSRRYHLKGCTGQGAFAQVFKACDEQDRDNIVVLKIQRPPCPWEYYIYFQLDKRISQEERASFGRAWKMHTYEDCSIMVCAYGERGTLQDVVNSYLATGQRMDELLCMYYTIEMLRMLEVLHSAGIIHGDFKPDNLLIRNESELLEDWAPDRPGYWKNQGLCLIDWGRSIDLKLYPPDTVLEGDCKTSGFRCIEMQQQRPWTYQVDTYGLCCVVHIMLHGSYMEIQPESNSENMQTFRPKVPFKRYHKREIWAELFTTLLNVKSCEENPSLGKLRRVFEEYLTSNTQFPKKMKELMVRQSKIMCSRS